MKTPFFHLFKNVKNPVFDELQGVNYPFGYQGSEKDDEISGNANTYSTYFRELDVRLGRWFAIDPETRLTPWESPYASMSNNPILLNDIFGDTTEVLSLDGDYLFRINDQMPNQVHYIDRSLIDKAKEDAIKDTDKKLSSEDKLAKAIRSKSKYYIASNTIKNLQNYWSASDKEQREKAGYLIISNGTKELSVWYCKTCLEYKDRVHYNKGNLPSNVNSLIINWHVHYNSSEYPNHDYISDGDIETGYDFESWGVHVGPAIVLTHDKIIFYRQASIRLGYPKVDKIGKNKHWFKLNYSFFGLYKLTN